MLKTGKKMVLKIKAYYRECDLASRTFVGTGLGIEAYLIVGHESVLLGCGFALASALALTSVVLELVARAGGPAA